MMPKLIPTKCQLCGADMVLVQPAIKRGESKSVAKGKCLRCQEEHEFTVLLNSVLNVRESRGRK